MNSSKRFNRRARISLGAIKNGVKKIIPILILAVIVFIFNNIFTIKKVNCIQNGHPCSQETQAVVNKLLGTNSLFVNQKELLGFIKAVYPADKIKIGYQALNTLSVNLEGASPFIQIDVYFVSKLPLLSMDQAPSSTDSAGWWIKPSKELESYISTNEALGFYLWGNGLITPIATTGANVSYIFSEKPTQEIISSVYKMINIVLKYLDVSKIYIINNRCFLSRPEQPDIIIGVPFDEGSLVPALQSISYLATIKKDAKVIDLSFKNPIIR
ncbi:MAG TPA: hypothetical protein VLH94_03505 [Spirochaetia bacterium]|nr:hypothetical protein [Spirochaetia bacterium]